MNVKDENANNISFIANMSWSEIVSDIKLRDENKN